MKAKPAALLILVLTSHFSIAQPGPRSIPNVAYDEKNGQVVVYGGTGENRQPLSDLWVLKGMEWKKLSDTGPKAFAPAFGYDSDRHKMILFAGYGNDRQLNDTWEWDGQKWNQVTISGPPARLHTMGIYDKKNKYFLIFGGYGSNGSLSDTWAYDGKSWKQLGNDGPKDCLPHGFVYDEAKNRVILITFDGKPDPADNTRKKNHMWEWTGSKWNELSTGTPSTTQRSLAALASFGKDGIVLFDGDDVSQRMGKTWTFSGGQWTSATIPGPSAPRIAHGMVFDKSRGKTILFGGTDRASDLGDLWEWDGKQWADVTAQWLIAHPDDVNALKTFATTMYQGGNFAKAEEVYKRLWVKNPKDVNSLVDMAVVAYALDRSDDAKGYFASAIATGNVTKPDYLKLARALYFQGKHAEVARYMEEALKLGPNGGEYYNLGCSYALTGDKDKAFLNLNKAIENGYAVKWQFENDTDLASLRSDERWAGVVSRVK